MSEILVPAKAYEIPKDYEGHIFISDIDKTYLATEIDSFLDLLKTAFETPERKGNVPGFSILLRAVRRGALENPAKKPLFFVSASPPQMEDSIQSKMELDGIEHEGIIFKNQLRNVRQGKFKKLREQIGYKLSALLKLWSILPKKSKLILFGDDSESDAIIYSLFISILAGHIEGSHLIELLKKLRVYREDYIRIAWMLRKIPRPSHPVEAVFINLATGTTPLYFSKFGPRFYPTENSLQAALALYGMGLIRDQAVISIGRDLLIHHDFHPKKLALSIEEAARRGLYTYQTLDQAWEILYNAKVLTETSNRTKDTGSVSLINYHINFDDLSKDDIFKNMLKRYAD